MGLFSDVFEGHRDKSHRWVDLATMKAYRVQISKPYVSMRASGNGYKWEVIPVHRGCEEQKGKEKEKGKGEKGKKERKREKEGEMKYEFRRSELVGPRRKFFIFDESVDPQFCPSALVFILWVSYSPIILI